MILQNNNDSNMFHLSDPKHRSVPDKDPRHRYGSNNIEVHPKGASQSEFPDENRPKSLKKHKGRSDTDK